MFVSQGLGVGLSLVSHLSLGGLLCLSGLKRCYSLCCVSLGCFSGRSQSLSLLESLDLGSLSCLDGLGGLGSLS